jgi:MFS family permease
MESGTRYRMRYLWTISLVAALGGLLFGYDWVVIGGAKPFYEKHFNLTSAWQSGWANSCALIGCLVGALISGGLTDKFGRKRLLILAGVLFLATGIGTALAGRFLWFVVFRLLGGVGIGLASNISPMYIAEVSPAEVRGKFVSLNQLTIVIGILAAMLVNLLIAGYGYAVDRDRLAEVTQPLPRAEQAVAIQQFVATQLPNLDPQKTADFLSRQGDNLTSEAVVDFLGKNKLKVEKVTVDVVRHGLVSWNWQPGWRWMFGSGTLPAILFFVAMFGVPESPRWLVKKGRGEQARKILARIAGPEYAGREMVQIEATMAGEIDRVHFGELLEPRMRTVLALGVFLAVFQQWCGINVIFNYAEEVFKSAGYAVSDIMLNIVITGVVNLIFTFVAIYTVDRLGRRTLMLAGAGGLAVTYALIGACYLAEFQGPYVLLLVMLAIACYGCTLAPVTWVVLSEIFPNRIRGAAMSVSVFSLWAACFLLTYTFPLLNRGLGPAYTFWIYGAICVVGFFVMRKQLPETKGKSLEQIERELVSP